MTTRAGRSSDLTRRRFLGGAVAVGAATAGVAAGVSALGRGVVGPATVGTHATRTGDVPRRRWDTEVVGTSVEGRPIVMHSNTTPHPFFTLLFVSAIHGDERGAGAIGGELVGTVIPDGVSCYGIPIANPDGWERGTRNNANDVDLNRNFPWGWVPFDGGRGALTEPESAALAAVMMAIRPSLVVWIHQPYAFVAPISTSAIPFARQWADASGLPMKLGVQQHGGAETWCARSLGAASILVEGTTRNATIEEIAAHRAGFEAVLAGLTR